MCVFKADSPREQHLFYKCVLLDRTLIMCLFVRSLLGSPQRLIGWFNALIVPLTEGATSHGGRLILTLIPSPSQTSDVVIFPPLAVLPKTFFQSVH